MFKSVRAKLLSVFGLGAVVFGVVLVQSVWNSSEMRTHLRGLYAHQVAPMEDLKEIVDAYAVDVVDATHKLRSGQFDWSGAEASINSAMSLIHERWSAYVAGDRSVEERTLIDSAAPLMAEADAGVADLLGFIAAQDMASVERFAVERLYQTIDPISGVVSELVAAKVGGVRALVAELEAHAGTAIVTGLVAAVIVLGIVAFGVFVVRNRILRPIDETRDAMARMAEGDLDGALSTKCQATEIARMIEALQVFQTTARKVMALEQAERAAAAREASAEERASMQRVVEDAVRRAADGDFAARIAARYSDPTLNAFAEQINRLLENVSVGCDSVARVMSRLAQGDLGARMDGEQKGAFATVQKNLNDTMVRLGEIVGRIRAASTNIHAQASEISGDADQLSGRAENQAASLEEISATMEEMSATVKTNADNAVSASSLARNASERADKGGAVVSQAASAMKRIEEGSSKIADIVSVIDGFAFQTNLLALNAAVEAARAGEAGKGFAVVASEVRSLAQRSADAARDIKALIEDSSHQVTDGVRLVGETGAALSAIVDGVRQVSETIAEISEASHEQASGVDEVASAITAMDQITQQNSGLAEASASAARSLAQEADGLEDALTFFKSGRDARAVAA